MLGRRSWRLPRLAWEPRRELARVYRHAERWKACVEVLKEAVEKATWPSAEAKVPVLLEMVELYRDRLKLDVMVVEVYNRILALQPNNIEVMDALAAQYEVIPRWPELISILRKKATIVGSAEEKIALYLRVATLYLEKFSNQAEAIKAFEAILEIDAGNAEALTFLKQMYEKRRDWDRLVAVLRQEIARVADSAERGKRWAEVAKLATEKLKKAAVSIELWGKVLEANDSDVEALTELEKLYEREKRWEELAAVLDKQVTLTDDPAKRGVILPKLATVYTEKLQKLDLAVAAWKTLLDAEPENRRAQDALRKLYLQNKDWDALEGFYSVQGKWDEFARVLERQAETETDPARVGLWNKIAVIYRDRLARRTRPRSLSRRRSPSMATTWRQPSLSSRCTRRPGTPSGWPRSCRCSLCTRKTQPSARSACCASPRFSMATLATSRWRSRWRCRRCPKIRARNGRANTPSGWPVRRATGPCWWMPTRLSLPSLQGQDALPVLATVARAYEMELANTEAAIARNREILEIADRDEQAVLALERLYIATGQHDQLLAIYDKKLALAGSEEEKREVRLQLAALYEEQVHDADKAIELYKDILKTAKEDVQALRALDRLYRATERWKDLAKIIARQLKLPNDDPSAAELKFRLGEVSEKHLKPWTLRWRRIKKPWRWTRTHAGARAALEAYLEDSEHQMSAVAALAAHLRGGTRGRAVAAGSAHPAGARDG
jgi:tetratricopeptide (TPR) repeat protein